MQSDRVKSLIEKHGPLTLNEIKNAKDNQQVIRNRTKSLPPQKATLESDYSTDDEEMVSINLENENSRLSRRDQKTAVRNERSTSESRGYKEGVPHMYGSIFIGDDYLLGVACFHLKFRGNFDDKVFKSGFCVSGQTIRDATEHIKRSITEDDERPKSGLVYLGASDIIKGKKFYEMKKDFDDFVKTCVTRNFSLVLCTLTPIPSHQVGGRTLTLKTFNSFLTNNTYNMPVIDMNKAFLRSPDVFEEYYFTENSIEVTGSEERLALWSREGQSRFHSIILKNLGFALLVATTRVFDDM